MPALHHRVLQDITEPPHGNALAACTASLLGLPLETVPNFVALPDYWTAMVAHAGEHGLALRKLTMLEGRLPENFSPGTLCIARGKSPRGDHGHVVVAAVAADGETLEMVHDPFEAGGFLDGAAAWAAFYEPRSESEPALATLGSHLRDAGFDVLQPFRVSWYNDLLRSKGLATDEDHVGGAAFRLSPLPDFGRRGDALALLVGNSRALWPTFLRWLGRQPERALTKDPVDTYAAEAIGRAVGEFAAGGASDTFWSADLSPERLVDMNRAALVSGLCFFSEDLYLSVHPAFGSWVAFRAVIVLDAPATHLGPPPPSKPDPLSEEERLAARAAFDAALAASSAADLSVDGMPLEVALKWAAMRDCVALGREHKYSELQSEYHYTKDAAVLARALEESEAAAEEE